MCLAGVDYFSTLGYQPALAALAAGLLAPFATIVLVLVTLCAALPVYRYVAKASPHGAGSIYMLEKLLHRWWAKLCVLVLLGFTITDFVITITLSSADAAAHIVANPFTPRFLSGQHILITFVMLALLCAVFLKGMRETISVAVALVASYLALSLVVIIRCLWELVNHPAILLNWHQMVSIEYPKPLLAIGLVLLSFPKLALGMSGFETGVVVMPEVDGGKGTKTEQVARRVRGTKKMLTTAALTMSLFLATSSLVTTTLIDQRQFQPGGQAEGRALAYLGHLYLGEGFGTVYDLATILILWFAGASAMSGLLNLIPRYLPRYGMAPSWARKARPMILIVTAVCSVVTLIFRASVEAQGGAYATGVLVLVTSASLAATLSTRSDWKSGKGKRFPVICYGAVTLIFAYVTVANMIERPDGLKIATCFTVAILVVSFLSRWRRSYELRVEEIHFDATALSFISHTPTTVRLIAHKPGSGRIGEYVEKRKRENVEHRLFDMAQPIFVEIELIDPSEFSSTIEVTGHKVGNFQVLRAKGHSVANALAALSLSIRDHTGHVPHLYFDWASGSPMANQIAFLMFGQGQVASSAHEILRRVEPNKYQRPYVHVA